MMIVPSGSEQGRSNLQLYREEPTPEVVYHYTSMETLLKIVEKPAIHATSVNYLNDTTEREHLFRMVRARLPEFSKVHQLTNSDILTAFGERDYNPDRIVTTPFAASFSEGDDLLTQWRSYCPNGNGVSIGFRTTCLETAAVRPLGKAHGSEFLDSAPTIRFQKVRYLEETQTSEIDDMISSAMNWANTIEKVSRESDPDVPISATDLFVMRIGSHACFIKNPAFSNEREYRLLVGPVFFNSELLEFRASKSTLIPYVEVLIPRKASAPVVASLAQKLTGRHGTDFIAKIVLGPTPNSALSVDAVESFLRKHSLNVEVAPSKVPFRDL